MRAQRRKAWLLTLACALTLYARAMLPGGAARLEEWLLGRPGNPVAQAFGALTDAMGQGSGLGEAVQAFCGELSGHGLS